jgi:hypothetical protein
MALVFRFSAIGCAEPADRRAVWTASSLTTVGYERRESMCGRLGVRDCSEPARA